MGVSVPSLLGRQRQDQDQNPVFWGRGAGAGGGVSSRAGGDQASWEGRGGLSIAGLLPGVHLSPCLSSCALSVMRRLSDCIPTISCKALEYGSFF